jgi:hypothetical protein
VRLSHPPAQSVPLAMSLSGTGLWASPPIIVIFTPSNWNLPRDVSVASLRDPDTVDDELKIKLSVTGYGSNLVTIQQVDDDD